MVLQPTWGHWSVEWSWESILGKMVRKGHEQNKGANKCTLCSKNIASWLDWLAQEIRSDYSLSTQVRRPRLYHISDWSIFVMEIAYKLCLVELKGDWKGDSRWGKKKRSSIYSASSVVSFSSLNIIKLGNDGTNAISWWSFLSRKSQINGTTDASF